MSGERISGEDILTYSFDFPRAGDGPFGQGKIKTQPADFDVEECMDLALSGEGEHAWLFIEKEGQNTEYLAKCLASYFGVKKMDVGFSGLKDRWAVTRQWFSIYIRNKELPKDIDIDLPGVRVLKASRHSRKLRRGEHYANKFEIVVRDLKVKASLQAELELIRERGFPNYFGMQRFGRDGENLFRAERLFLGEIKASRSQRSFYLSASRSYIYNRLLAEKVEAGDWLLDEIGGPLYGDDIDGVAPASEIEKQFFEQYPVLVKGIHKNRMTLARRPYRMRAQDFSWELTSDTLTLKFMLATGAFATSLLDEILDIEDLGGQREKEEH